jgi:fatty-acyl-CoA synthase
VYLMRTYYKKPPEECLDDEGWFHTQDAGYLDEGGFLHWHGRISAMIKTGGANVSPVEVETRAIEQEWVGVASTVGVPHPGLSEVVVLCIVPIKGSEPAIPELMDHLRGRLSSYKVPRRVLVCRDEDLGFTASEKVRVDALRRVAAERIVETDDDVEWVTFLKEWLHQR